MPEAATRISPASWNTARIRYVCEQCEQPIAEHHKTRMLAQGEWRATADSSDPLTIGFHTSSLYSPVGWLSWERIARDWEAAQGSDEAKRSFVNSVLGETWADTGEAPDWRRIADRREDYRRGTVPAGGLFLTAGADVQRDRIEVDIWAWGRGLESWLVDRITIEGGPERAATWAALSELLAGTWMHAHGMPLTLARLATDTGYEAAAVYAWARGQGFGRVLPVKGVDGFDRSAPVSGPTWVEASEGAKKIRRGARLWRVSVAVFKSETYRFLRLERPTEEEIAEGVVHPSGYIHLPAGIDTEWCKQLVAEQLMTVKTKRGFSRLEWQKMRERNEALDCRVYARAAAWVAGADRWSEARWRDLEAQIAPTEVEASEPAAADGPTAPAIAGRLRNPGRRSRRVFQSSYLS
jgi:phage terminase large subunit GpA-like protein